MRVSNHAGLFAAFALTLLAPPALAQSDNNLHGRVEVQDAGQFTGADSI